MSVPTHKVPDKRSQPVHVRANSADQVKMFGFADALADQVDYEAGGHKRHGEHHTDGDKDIDNTLVTENKQTSRQRTWHLR